MLFLNTKFEAIDAKFEAMATRFDAKFEAMESRFDAKFEGMESRFDAKLSAMDSRQTKWMIATIIAAVGLAAGIAKFFG
jgi:hypothetical protein